MRRNFTSAGSVRAVAVFELSKELFSPAIRIVLISLLHKDLIQTATAILGRLHIDKAGFLARALLEGTAQINESNIKLFIVLVCVYTLVRFVEAYGFVAAANLGGMVGDCVRRDLSAVRDLRNHQESDSIKVCYFLFERRAGRLSGLRSARSELS